MRAEMLVAFHGARPAERIERRRDLVDVGCAFLEVLEQPRRGRTPGARVERRERIIATPRIRTHRSGDDDLAARDPARFGEGARAQRRRDVLHRVDEQDDVDRVASEREGGRGPAACDQLGRRWRREPDLETEAAPAEVGRDPVASRADLEEGALVAAQAFEERRVPDELVDHDFRERTERRLVRSCIWMPSRRSRDPAARRLAA
jgi:hypothetical protein